MEQALDLHVPLAARFASGRAWVVLSVLVVFAVFLSALQWNVNGSESPYATDIGEIQNALPRWGLIHFPGYPLYAATGSLFVTVLRLVGIQPAAGASLFSALAGAVSIGLLVLLALALEVPGPAAVLGGLIVAVSTSTWIDASIAEVHALSMAFTVATLLLALYFQRTGSRAALLGLTLAFTQGVAHQRALIFLAPAVLLFVLPRLRIVWRNLLPVLGLAALAPLVYVYLPIRAWMGAPQWAFGQPNTWRGFWSVFLDTKANRILQVPADPAGWLARLGAALQLLNDDLPLLLIALGLAALVLPALRGRRLESAGLILAGLPYLALCLVIWEGTVSDALLAAKLPVIYLAGLGLSLLAAEIARRWSRRGLAASVAGLGVLCAGLFVAHRPAVLAITRDASAETVIATAAGLPLPPDSPTTLMALWGHDFWALAYAQAYRGQLPGLNLVDHNADFQAILDRGDRLLTLEKTFYERPLSWWDKRLGKVRLTSRAPGVVEIARQPRITPSEVPAGPGQDLGNGLRIAYAGVGRPHPGELLLTVYWQADEAVKRDYSVAVHLLAVNPPAGPQDILAQADRKHPVGGWYPTSRWQAGEIVRDDYLMAVRPGAQPAGIRIGMYRVDSKGQFTNTEWLFLPLR